MTIIEIAKQVYGTQYTEQDLRFATLVRAEREWVELTDDELDELIRKWHSPDMGLLDFAWAVIAAFKEKNK